MTSAWRRFVSLEGHDRRLVVEAAVLLALVWSGLRLLPFLQLKRMLDRYAGSPRRSQPPTTAALDRIPWAVDAAAERIVFSATCLVRALVADAMLRRRGFATQLRVGVRLSGQRPSRAIEAHAWLEYNDRVIVGDLADIHEYAVPAAPHGL